MWYVLDINVSGGVTHVYIRYRIYQQLYGREMIYGSFTCSMHYVTRYLGKKMQDEQDE